MSRKFPSAFEAASLNYDKLGVRDRPPSSPIRLLFAVIYRVGNELESALKMLLAYNGSNRNNYCRAIKILIHYMKNCGALFVPAVKKREKLSEFYNSNFIKM